MKHGSESDKHGRFRGWATSAALIACTTVVGLLCVAVLACTLTQTRMSGIAIDGVNIGIWKLDDIRKQWTDLRDQIRAQADALTQAETARSNAAKAVADNDIKYRPARSALDAKLEEFNFRVRPFDDALAKAMSGQSPAEQVGRLDAAKESLKAHPELLPLIETIAALYKTYQPIGEERLRVQATLRAATARATELQESLKTLRASLDASFNQTSKKPIDDPTRARIENALFELYTGKGVPAKFFNFLITTQPDILTLTLVILMGVLGSALQMTHALFKRNQV